MHVNDRLGIINSFQLFVARGGFIERKTLRGIISDTIIFVSILIFSLVICRSIVWISVNINRIAQIAHPCLQMSFIFGLVLICVAIVGGMVTTRVASAATGINPELSFEGKVVNSSGINIADGTYNMEFKIYAGGTATGGGTLDWTEDWLVSAGKGVTFTSGTFQANLGSITAFASSVDWNSNPLYLSLQVGNTSSCTPAGNFHANCGGDGEMSPYILLTATPYAMNADKLDGIDSTGFVQLNATQSGNINIGSGTITSGAINGISIGSTIQPSASGALTVSSNGSNALTLTGGASSTLSTTSGNLTVQSGSGTVSLGSSTTLTATGALTVQSGGANALSFDTGGGAAINIGGTNATSVVIGGNTSATITEKVANSSTTAFTLQTAGGTNLLVANSTGGELYVGGSATAATPVLLVFGQKTATGDPTGVNGAEYYNSANNKFRCDQNSIWSDCISGFNTITQTADQQATQSSTAMQNDTTLAFAMNASTTYAVDAWIPVDDSNTTADMQYTYTTPAGATIDLMTTFMTAAATSQICNIIASGQVCADANAVNSTVDFIQVHGFVTNGATAGNLQFQFAQRVATAASYPVIKKGATMTWHQSN